MFGWIKLHRGLLDKAVWLKSTPEQKVILITLLCEVNYTPNQWIWKGKKFNVMPGQIITSLKSISKAANVSIRNVRTALTNFEKLEFLTNESTKAGRLITICNWDTYQSYEIEDDKVNDKGVTKRRQRGDKELTPIKERKNIKKEKKENIYPEILFKNSKYKDFEKFKREIGNKWQKYDLKHYYDRVMDWSNSKNNTGVDWLAISRGFIRNDIKSGKAKLNPDREIIR